MREPQQANDPSLTAALVELIGKGLTFANAVEAFAHQQDKSDATQDDEALPYPRTVYREWARDDYQQEGSIEIDDEAIVSGTRTGGGAYVMAWVWVDNTEGPE